MKDDESGKAERSICEIIKNPEEKLKQIKANSINKKSWEREICRDSIKQLICDLKEMIEFGIDAKWFDDDKKTLLHHIAESNPKYRFREIVSLLVDQDANINAQDNSGNTPLHYAARTGHDEFILFLDIQADKYQQMLDASLLNHQQQNPLHCFFRYAGEQQPRQHYFFQSKNNDASLGLLRQRVFLRLQALGADMSQKDCFGRLPGDYCLQLMFKLPPIRGLHTNKRNPDSGKKQLFFLLALTKSGNSGDKPGGGPSDSSPPPAPTSKL